MPDHTRQPLTTILVDDEAPARARLRRGLDADGRLRIVDECADGASAVDTIERLRPHVVFLDIQMPGLSGLDVLGLVRPPHPRVVFVTAYDQFAIRAFELAALDYLLKPFSDARLVEAVNRALQQSGRTQAQPIAPAPGAANDPRLPVRRLDRVHLVAISEITHLLSEHRLIRVQVDNGDRYWTPLTLDALQTRLEGFPFFRVHRSALVNLDKVAQIEPWRDGRLKLHLVNGAVVTAARGPALRLKAQLNL